MTWSGGNSTPQQAAHVWRWHPLTGAFCNPLCAAAARAKQEALEALPEGYGRPDYDPVAGELAMLPRLFSEADLEAVVEERSAVLEVPRICALYLYRN